jgi:uncharacterized membrane protein
MPPPTSHNAEMPGSEPAAGEPVLFDATLRPHRSMPAAGLAALMIAVGLVSFGAGLAFYLIGAWPVVGFLGLDVGLLWLAFRLNNRGARAVETVHLTPSALTVERVAVNGRRSRWQTQPYWLRVEFDDPPEPDSQLRLRSHGRSVVVGSFLPPEQRLDLATGLRDALDRLRRWRF